jgi:heme-degrading monooxygenase HmoA
MSKNHRFLLFILYSITSSQAAYEKLRPLLDEIDGFISIERFESLSEPGKILSLAFWRDEKAVETWRQLKKHRAAQSYGREKAFKDYRLRIAGVIRDYGMFERELAPSDSRRLHG